MHPVHRAEAVNAAPLELTEEKYPMENGSTASNRRREERITPNANIYVVVDTTPQMLGQMVEISISGLAFTFVDLENASKRLMNRTNLSLDLFAGGKGYFTKNLHCSLKSKIEEHPVSTHASPSIIRVGVEFEDLTLPQQIQINALIRWSGARSQ
jgi:hypothetical protein